ncbi:hypothetical protein L3V83_03540 [Thiotrichales bacterium 19X7-9]|nr:hypothetical protein [Thiotrichales bacterium 19X7-9]
MKDLDKRILKSKIEFALSFNHDAEEFRILQQEAIALKRLFAESDLSDYSRSDKLIANFNQHFNRYFPDAPNFQTIEAPRFDQVKEEVASLVQTYPIQAFSNTSELLESQSKGSFRISGSTLSTKTDTNFFYIDNYAQQSLHGGSLKPNYADTGFKFHISILDEDMEKAYAIMIDLLKKGNSPIAKMKITLINSIYQRKQQAIEELNELYKKREEFRILEKEGKLSERDKNYNIPKNEDDILRMISFIKSTNRFMNNCQFTLYINEGIEDKAYIEFIQTLERQFLNAGIRPGHMPIADQSLSLYASGRYELNEQGNYIAAGEVESLNGQAKAFYQKKHDENTIFQGVKYATCIQLEQWLNQRFPQLIIPDFSQHTNYELKQLTNAIIEFNQKYGSEVSANTIQAILNLAKLNINYLEQLNFEDFQQINTLSGHGYDVHEVISGLFFTKKANPVIGYQLNTLREELLAFEKEKNFINQCLLKHDVHQISLMQLSVKDYHELIKVKSSTNHEKDILNAYHNIVLQRLLIQRDIQAAEALKERQNNIQLGEQIAKQFSLPAAILTTLDENDFQAIGFKAQSLLPRHALASTLQAKGLNGFAERLISEAGQIDYELTIDNLLKNYGINDNCSNFLNQDQITSIGKAMLEKPQDDPLDIFIEKLNEFNSPLRKIITLWASQNKPIIQKTRQFVDQLADNFQLVINFNSSELLKLNQLLYRHEFKANPLNAVAKVYEDNGYHMAANKFRNTNNLYLDGIQLLQHLLPEQLAHDITPYLKAHHIVNLQKAHQEGLGQQGLLNRLLLSLKSNSDESHQLSVTTLAIGSLLEDYHNAYQSIISIAPSQNLATLIEHIKPIDLIKAVNMLNVQDDCNYLNRLLINLDDQDIKNTKILKEFSDDFQRGIALLQASSFGQYPQVRSHCSIDQIAKLGQQVRQYNKPLQAVEQLFHQINQKYPEGAPQICRDLITVRNKLSSCGYPNDIIYRLDIQKVMPLLFPTLKDTKQFHKNTKLLLADYQVDPAIELLKTPVPTEYENDHGIESQIIVIGERSGQSYFTSQSEVLEDDSFESRVENEEKKIEQLKQNWDQRNGFDFDEYKNLTLAQKLQLNRLHAIKDELKGKVTFDGLRLKLEDADSKTIMMHENLKKIFEFSGSDAFLEEKQIHFMRIINLYNDQFKQVNDKLDSEVLRLFLKETHLINSFGPLGENGLPVNFEQSIVELKQRELELLTISQLMDQALTSINYPNRGFYLPIEDMLSIKDKLIERKDDDIGLIHTLITSLEEKGNKELAQQLSNHQQSFYQSTITNIFKQYGISEEQLDLQANQYQMMYQFYAQYLKSEGKAPSISIMLDMYKKATNQVQGDFLETLVINNLQDINKALALITQACQKYHLPNEKLNELSNTELLSIYDAYRFQGKSLIGALADTYLTKGDAQFARKLLKIDPANFKCRDLLSNTCYVSEARIAQIEPSELYQLYNAMEQGNQNNILMILDKHQSGLSMLAQYYNAGIVALKEKSQELPLLIDVEYMVQTGKKTYEARTPAITHRELFYQQSKNQKPSDNSYENSK